MEYKKKVSTETRGHCDWHCRIFKQTRDLQEISLLRKHLMVWENRLDTCLDVNMAEGQEIGSSRSLDTFPRLPHMFLAVLLRELQPWASMKEWAILSSC